MRQRVASTQKQLTWKIYSGDNLFFGLPFETGKEIGYQRPALLP